MLDEPTWIEPSELAILARLERDPTQMASVNCQHSVADDGTYTTS